MAAPGAPGAEAAEPPRTEAYDEFFSLLTAHVRSALPSSDGLDVGSLAGDALSAVAGKLGDFFWDPTFRALVVIVATEADPTSTEVVELFFEDFEGLDASVIGRKGKVLVVLKKQPDARTARALTVLGPEDVASLPGLLKTLLDTCAEDMEGDDGWRKHFLGSVQAAIDAMEALEDSEASDSPGDGEDVVEMGKKREKKKTKNLAVYGFSGEEFQRLTAPVAPAGAPAGRGAPRAGGGAGAVFGDRNFGSLGTFFSGLVTFCEKNPGDVVAQKLVDNLRGHGGTVSELHRYGTGDGRRAADPEPHYTVKSGGTFHVHPSEVVGEVADVTQ